MIQDKSNIQQQFQVGVDYILPKWSGKPSKSYYFEVIKNGAYLEDLQIKEKAFYLIGKLDLVCDILLEHPSISRKHCILQHSKENEVFLYDLGSSHGTEVNKQKIPSKVYHKLKVYDIIKFGQSTRSYILRCQELEEQMNEVQEQKFREYEEKKIQDSMKKAYQELLDKDPYFQSLNKAGKFQGMEEKEKKEKEENGVSWGMFDEQDVYGYYQNAENRALEPDLLRRIPGLSDKHIEKIQKYEEKMEKLNQVQQDLENFEKKHKKAGHELTEKEQDKIEQLQQKVIEMQSQIEQAEETIRATFFGETVKSLEEEEQRKRKLFDAVYDEKEDDEYFDRTNVQKKVKTNKDYEQELMQQKQKVSNNTQNYWELKKNYESLLQQRESINLQILNLKNEKSEKKDQKINTEQNQELIQENKEEQNIQEEEDELDKFMKENNQQQEKETKEKLIQQLKQIQENLIETSHLLTLVKPDMNLIEQKVNFKNIFEDDDNED